MENSKYFKVEKIFARLAGIYKKKMNEVSIGTIAEWCAEIEVEVLGHYSQFIRYDKHEITVVDGKALLPCNIHRLLDVYNSSNTRIMRYHNNGVYISFSEYGGSVADGSTLYINYKGIPIDSETGFPLFLRGHEQACYTGCVLRLHEEDYSMGKMRGDVYETMQTKYEVALRSANTGFRHVSRNDMKDYLAVVCNAIQKVNKTPYSL